MDLRSWVLSATFFVSNLLLLIIIILDCLASFHDSCFIHSDTILNFFHSFFHGMITYWQVFASQLSDYCSATEFLCGNWRRQKLIFFFLLLEVIKLFLHQGDWFESEVFFSCMIFFLVHLFWPRCWVTLCVPWCWKVYLKESTNFMVLLSSKHCLFTLDDDSSGFGCWHWLGCWIWGSEFIDRVKI